MLNRRQFTGALAASGDLYGQDRIERLASRLFDQPARLVATSLLAEVDTFAAAEPAQDDMTVLVVRRPV